MENEVENRLKELNEIEIFARTVENEATIMLQSLGWSSDIIRDNAFHISSNCKCPLDSGHYVQKNKMKLHLAGCQLKHDGYKNDDLLLPENCNPSTTTVIIEPSLRSSILTHASKMNAHFIAGIQNLSNDTRPTPLTLEKMQSDFTQDERRAMYEFVLAKAPTNDDVSDDQFFIKDNQSQQSKNFKSHLEELAEMRDLKRRRTKYRVSTKSKAYTEIIREVINNQMLSYVEMLNEKTKHHLHEKPNYKPFDSSNETLEERACHSRDVSQKKTKGFEKCQNENKSFGLDSKTTKRHFDLEHYYKDESKNEKGKKFKYSKNSKQSSSYKYY